MDGSSVTQQVAALDGSPAVAYQDNWSDFLLDNESSNGQWLAQRDASVRSYWNLLRPGVVASQGAAWFGGTEGFDATRICPGNNGTRFVSQASFSDWSVNAQGYATFNQFFGIWFARSDSEQGHDATLPRLLIKNGRFVDWFDDSK